MNQKNQIAVEDVLLCEEIKTSIGNILKYSSKGSFKKKCFEIAEVDSIFALEKKLKDQMFQTLQRYPASAVDIEKENRLLSSIREQRTPSKNNVSLQQTTTWLDVASQRSLNFLEISRTDHILRDITSSSHETEISTRKTDYFPSDNTPTSYEDPFGLSAPAIFPLGDNVRKILFSNEEKDESNIFNYL